MEEAGESGNLHVPGHAEAPDRQRRVFISYASHDAPLAQEVCSALEAAGFLCWIAPRNVVPGTLYAEGIVRAIDESAIVVLILSEQAIASAHVGKELERATSKRHPIIALRTDTAQLTPAFEYFLNESQWVDAGSARTGAAIAQLVGAVGQHLLRVPATSNAPNARTTGRRSAKPRQAWVIAAAFIVLALAAAYFLAEKAWLSMPLTGKKEAIAPTTVVSDKSIAVLPFTDMSEKKDQEYFADGMAEEITDLLARIPGIRVMSRTSSFQFKGHSEDLRTLGTKLGVAHVLEGSVRKSGDRVRVTAQLIDVSDGFHRWSGSYDRDLVDVLKVQDEISWGLVRALQVSMGADEPGSRPALKSVDAYALYLQGRQAFNRYDRQGYDQAASYFRQAMELDRESALAPTWLALGYYMLAAYGLAQPDTSFEEARRYAERALALDPRSELATAVLGSIHIVYDWDWAAGASELDRALALAPGNARILLLHSLAPTALGQWDTAIRDVSASVALDPLYPSGYYMLGHNHLGAAHWSEAEAAFDRALDIAPNYAGVHAVLAEALLFRGEKQAALTQIDLEPVEAAQWAGRAAINHALDRKADSDAALKRLTELTSEPDTAYLVARVHAYRGESDAAFVWLERAFTRRDISLWRIKGDAYLSPLKGDPRYKAFLRKIKLPE
jgi:TolB-like protein/tetratricopeptide (TPR) repeat protein